MKVRPARGLGMTIDESMEHVVDVSDWDSLIRLLSEQYDFWSPTAENVTVEHYCYDERICWDTYLICIDGKAALFSDGPMARPADNEESSR